MAEKATKKEKREKIPRQPMAEQEPKVRAKNFDEVPMRFLLAIVRKKRLKRPNGVCNAKSRAVWPAAPSRLIYRALSN
jgi:hypothetical protein